MLGLVGVLIVAFVLVYAMRRRNHTHRTADGSGVSFENPMYEHHAADTTLSYAECGEQSSESAYQDVAVAYGDADYSGSKADAFAHAGYADLNVSRTTALNDDGAYVDVAPTANFAVGASYGQEDSDVDV